MVLMGSHETSRKTAHPLPNVPTSAFRPFQFRALSPGESHPRRTGHTPCCGPRTDQITCTRGHRLHTKGQPGSKGCPTLKSSQAPAFLSLGGSKLRGAGFAPLPAPSEHLADLPARGRGAEEKLLSWPSAQHYIARVSHILTVSILGSQMTSFPDDTPRPTHG